MTEKHNAQIPHVGEKAWRSPSWGRRLLQELLDGKCVSSRERSAFSSGVQDQTAIKPNLGILTLPCHFFAVTLGCQSVNLGYSWNAWQIALRTKHQSLPALFQSTTNKRSFWSSQSEPRYWLFHHISTRWRPYSSHNLGYTFQGFLTKTSTKTKNLINLCQFSDIL